MRKYYYECDCCGKRLETKKMQTPFGKVEVICDTAKTQEWDTTGIYKYLCKECALKIDNNLLRLKMELLKDSKCCSGGIREYNRIAQQKSRAKRKALKGVE